MQVRTGFDCAQFDSSYWTGVRQTPRWRLFYLVSFVFYCTGNLKADECCAPISGACTDVTPAACVGLGGVPGAPGSTCDQDGGFDAGLQHCCPQPFEMACMGGPSNGLPCAVPADCPTGACILRSSGANQHFDARLNFVVVPPSGSPPVVVTLTGDNTPASSSIAAPDACFAPGGVDPGWWEGIAIDKCSFLRVDYGCTAPARLAPTFRLFDGSAPALPCNAPVEPRLNPYHPADPATGAGLPHTPDGNPWAYFGPLEPGIYYIQIDASAGKIGPYQLHVTVEPCPAGACCHQQCAVSTRPCSILDPCLPAEGACVDVCAVVNEVECRTGLHGYFFGPPNLPPPPFPGCIFGFCGGVCGDGVLGPNEQCDDGGLVAGDGCNPICEAEPPPVVPSANRSNRFLSFSVPPPGLAGGFDGRVALRIEMIDLHNPIPSNAPCCPPTPFPSYESPTCAPPEDVLFGQCARWVGRPFSYFEGNCLATPG